MQPQNAALGTDEQPTQHAFVVFGYEHSYLAHSAMFQMQPHAYQAIQELYLEPVPDARAYLEEFRRQSPQTLLLGLSLETKVLYDLLRDRFQMQLYKESIDDKNKLMVVTAVPGRLMYYLPLHADGPDYPRELTYFIYGRGVETFMSHVITRRPNFHHEVTLAGTPPGISAADLERGVVVTIPGIPDGFHSTDPLPEAIYPIILPGGSKSFVQIFRRDRFTYQALNGS
ncbi:hypothetical protein [Chondromyces crocatus]|uniref:Uncharacterized protein n=1 Tax=Chondromyces crocatus TaxID=52 RepID=A0A0K1EB76_CHOCO|nr:hypothetical protein [Chondromyces crocatus]AKT38110.1 uncharacterized protein CMC5_022520 [Chondromyces crocatus]